MHFGCISIEIVPYHATDAFYGFMNYMHTYTCTVIHKSLNGEAGSFSIRQKHELNRAHRKPLSTAHTNPFFLADVNACVLLCFRLKMYAVPLKFMLCECCILKVFLGRKFMALHVKMQL